MIIECNNCESKVDGQVLAEHEVYEDPEIPIPEYKVSLLKCPVCNKAIVAVQDFIEIAKDDWDFISGVRVWPQPEKHLSWYLPDLVRASIEEAEKCYKAKAYSACAVMCGRVLEGICIEYKTKNKFLAGGLKELLDKQLIDKKIFEWGEALRLHRNIGAHATKETISREDAKDLLDFANVICDYIFVLTKKFEDFIKRKQKITEDDIPF